jgi:hypothetical protein
MRPNAFAGPSVWTVRAPAYLIPKGPT